MRNLLFQTIKLFIFIVFAICLYACNSATKDHAATKDTIKETMQIVSDENAVLDPKKQEKDTQFFNILTKFQTIEKGLNSYSKKYGTMEEDGLIVELTGYYGTQGIPKKVEVVEVMAHGSFKRSYYTQEGYLYFMFEEEVSEASVQGLFTYREKRLYFNDEKLIGVLTKEKTIASGQQINFNEITSVDATKSIADKQAEINKYNTSLTKALQVLSATKTVPSDVALISFSNGRWISKDDAMSGIEIKGDKWILFYKEGAKESQTIFNYELSKNTSNGQTENHLKLTQGAETIEYAILSYTNSELKLLYLDRGNILTYTPDRALSSTNLEVFTEWPTALQGCSCSFGETQNDVYHKKYTYADNHEETAIISIDGKMTTFKLTEAKPYSKSSITKTFASGKYTLKLEVKNIGTSDTQYLYKGTVTLSKHHEVIVIDYVEGSCGC